ncbi:MAG: hypothetical protein AAFP19_17680 [Bacteroidota bacterium]
MISLSKYRFLALMLFMFSHTILSGQQREFDTAYLLLSNMLESNMNISFKDAVFAVENAYSDGLLDKNKYETQVEILTRIALSVAENSSLDYTNRDRSTVLKYAALYTLITDTTTILTNGDTWYHYPFIYDFDDPFATNDWSSMFVTKLLATKKGNCHSMPYLYKILADELGIEAHLAIAPNHIYIKNRCEKIGWYNTELTSASFPIDAWIMASGYVYLEAIQNGVYMVALDDKESIAMCVADLAMGYNRKFPNNDGAFILKCCELALKHFPNYITAILLKAETQKRLIEQMMEQHNVEQPKKLFTITDDAKPLWDEMQQTYFKAHRVGYRQMPKQMYLDWLASLQTEREKYNNCKVVRFDE